MSAKFPRGGGNPFSAIRLIYIEMHKSFQMKSYYTQSSQNANEPKPVWMGYG